MFSLIHYISASRRLDECNKTIIMLGGSEFHDGNIPMQLAAQRDMIKIEVKYYEEQVKIFGLLSLVFGIVGIATTMILFHFGVF
jgi:hypothetical protein